MDAAVEDRDLGSARRACARPRVRRTRPAGPTRNRPGSSSIRVAAVAGIGLPGAPRSPRAAAPSEARSSGASSSAYGMPSPPPASTSRSGNPASRATVGRDLDERSPRGRRAPSRRGRSTRRRRGSRAGSRNGEAAASAAAARTSSRSIPNLPAPSSPMIRTRSPGPAPDIVRRRRIGWRRPMAAAIDARRRSSPSDSTVTTRTPASTAAASSSSRLPGPVNTTCPASNPARSTCASSPPEATSAPTPRPARCARTASSGFALTANARSNDAGSTARSAATCARRRRRGRRRRTACRTVRRAPRDPRRRGGRRGGCRAASPSGSSKRILQGDPGVRARVAVLDQQRDRHAEPVLAREVAAERPRPGHHDGARRDGERCVGRAGAARGRGPDRRAGTSR